MKLLSLDSTKQARDGLRPDKSTALSKAEIIEKWDLGIYSHLAYVDAALAHDGRTDIDIENFIFEWSGVADPDTGRTKRLTKRHLLAAIAALDEKGVISLQNTQLTIDFEGWRKQEKADGRD